MGNELVGRRGVFVDPNIPKWNQTPENMEATGIWENVASRVCGQIQRLAALKAGRVSIAFNFWVTPIRAITSCRQSIGMQCVCSLLTQGAVG